MPREWLRCMQQNMGPEELPSAPSDVFTSQLNAQVDVSINNLICQLVLL